MPRKYKRRNKYTAEKFINAAFNGNMDYVTAALTHGIDVNVVHPNNGFTALMLAAQNGRLDIVRLLLEKGANVNQAATAGGTTALMLAAQDGHLETVLLLLEKGANVNLACTDNGATALMYAAEDGQLETVRLLLEKGADVTKTDFDGCTAVDDAFNNGHSEIFDLIFAKQHELAAVKHSKKETLKKSDSSQTPSFQDRLDEIKFKDDVPKKFCCPIGLSIMNDPIAVSSGRTYDRVNLKDWFKSKGDPLKITDPETRDIIHRSELENKTNIFVKDAIDAFVVAREEEHRMQNTKKIKKKKPKHGPKLFDVTSNRHCEPAMRARQSQENSMSLNEIASSPRSSQ